MGRVDELVHTSIPDFRFDGLIKKLEEIANQRALDMFLEGEKYKEALVSFQNNVNRCNEN